MKAIFTTLLIILMTACSKSNNTAPTPPVVKPDAVKIQSALLKDYSGVTELELTIAINDASFASKINLVVYDSSWAGSGDHKYSIPVQMGTQIFVLANYGKTNPMNYQWEFFYANGTTNFSPLFQQAYH